MPADDLIINVRQIAGYPPVTSALGSDTIVLQRGGLGGPYMSIDAADFVSTALAAPGDAMTIGGSLTVAGLLTAQTGTFFNASVLNLFSAASASIGTFACSIGTMNGARLATISLSDLLAMGGAPLFSPVFGGEPRAPTPPSSSHSSRLATTAFVHRNSVEYINGLLLEHPFVFTFNGRSGDVVLTAADIAGAGGEFFDSVALTGVPTAPTAPPGTDTTQIATTEFVQTAVENLPYAPINSPQFTGFPSGPTAPLGASTGQLATTAFVQEAITAGTAGVASFNTRTGAVTLTGADITGAGGALTISPTFTGTPQGPTAAPGTNNAQLATTAFVEAAIGGGGVSSFNGRSGPVTLTTADVTGAGGATSSSPVFTGNPTAPTPAPGDSDTSIATTAFVQNAIASGGVTSFNTRTGSITLLASDISAAGGAVLASPIFTGIPQAPTAAPTVATAQIATCAFVAAAINGSVASFNGRSGNVTLTLADITGAGGAPLASPHFTGTPSAPTETPGDNTTALATTAFVTAAIAAGGVASFNGRAGAVTLTGADVSGAGGALIASPAFTGTPSAPTAAAATSTTQIATTAFVMNALGTVGGVTSFNGRAGVVTLSAADVSAAGGPYLPLTGGALTGNLSAVTGTFSGNLVATGSITAGAGGQVSAGTRIIPSSSLDANFNLFVNGTISRVIQWSAGNFVTFLNTSAGSIVNQTSGGQLTFNNAGTLILAQSTATKPGGGPWDAPSDDRIKRRSEPYTTGLKAVLELKPIAYEYNGEGGTPDDGKTYFGLSAQATRPVMPELVKNVDVPLGMNPLGKMIDHDPMLLPGQLSVDATALTFALVNCIKELAARLAALEMRMAT